MVESPDVYEPDPEEKVSETVIRAVADAKDTDPTALDVRLYDAVDPDALDALFSGSERRVRITFSLADRRVVVDESRRVFVTRARETRDPEPDRSRSLDPTILRGATSPWRIVAQRSGRSNSGRRPRRTCPGSRSGE